MADVTISSLSRSIPNGNSIIPFSSANTTLGATVSSIFQNGSIVGIGTTTPSMPNEGYPVGSGIEVFNDVVAGIKFSGQNGYSYIRHADNTVTSNLIIAADYSQTSSGVPELILRVKNADVLNIRSNKVVISQPVEMPEDIKSKNTPKAYVNFDGSRTTTGAAAGNNVDVFIRSSYNVSRVRRESDGGKYTVYFSSPSPVSNENYVVNVAAGNTANTNILPQIGNYDFLPAFTTSSFRLYFHNTSVPITPTHAHVVIHGT